MRLVFKKVARTGWGQTYKFDHDLRLKGGHLATVTQTGVRGGGHGYWYGQGVNTLHLDPPQTWKSLGQAKEACREHVRKKLKERS